MTELMSNSKALSVRMMRVIYADDCLALRCVTIKKSRHIAFDFALADSNSFVARY